jgi:hypothetical protein
MFSRKRKTSLDVLGKIRLLLRSFFDSRIGQPLVERVAAATRSKTDEVAVCQDRKWGI